MKAIKILFFLLLIFTMKGFSQEPQLKQLELTTSPAYALLGVQPTNIQRPSTPRDFAAGLQSSLVNGILQPNFAMEVNPFNWSKKAPKNKYSFIANDYFSSKPFPAIKKNFALSLATSATDTVKFGDLTKGTGIGYGARITILPGTVNRKTRNDFKAWASVEVKDLFLGVVESFVTAPDHTFSYDDINRAYDMTVANLLTREDISDEMKPAIRNELTVYKGQLAAFKDSAALVDQLNTDRGTFAADKIKALDRINARKTPFARDGFILEVAYSGVTVLQNNTWDSSIYAKTGIWITPSYRIDLSSDEDPKLVQSFDMLGILRYMWNNKNVDKGNYLDFGAKLQFNRNDWNLGFEGLFRHASEVPAGINSRWTYSWVTNFSYTIQENITLRLSFGSQFDGNTRTYTKPNEVLAVGGISFGFLK